MKLEIDKQLSNGGVGLQDFTQYNDLYNFARDNGVDAVKKLLRNYVESGQPECFMPGYTSRAICRCAGHGLDGGDINSMPYSYTDTTYGFDLYSHMWSIE